ncbi:hypothetical protein SAY87_006915 [Trapa incisa]|uniref:Peptidase M1 leukotriene A4 hydrolase/aminopeptidase C-terminal domain-containing protein n=1 Tax=Trapa incisa TaxID=236973 RepID=A0AAN7K3G8_9MYRT|nr:hypothetical protein SAY87_006915 [Trapa incisa]
MASLLMPMNLFLTCTLRLFHLQVSSRLGGCQKKMRLPTGMDRNGSFTLRTYQNPLKPPRCCNYYGKVEKILKEVGRMKYLRPLYTALVQGTGKDEEKIFAKRVFAETRECYHPIAQGVVESIFSKHM